MGRLSEVKILLGISDDIQDDLLGVIEKLTVSHFKSYTGADNVPDDFDWLIVEVMVKRFNRIGSEGMATRSVEGLSMSFSTDDLADYADILNRYFKKRSESQGVKFI